MRQLANWGQFEKQIKPNFDFKRSLSPSSPDYKKMSSWAAHPKVVSKVAFTPLGVLANTAYKEGLVDCFFIYPTLFFSNKHWNAPVDHQGVNELVEEMIMPGQASVFNTCCRIFAPRYRQATFYTFLGAGQNGRQALELAFEDILTAFNYYLRHNNQGRPFFIAGHSQGALHVMRLLEERIEGTSLVKQLVAAYPIGFSFPLDKFGQTLKELRPATSATSINCIVAWDTYLLTGRPIHLLDRAEICYVMDGQIRWEKRARKVVLGVNPLDWKRSRTMVSADQHIGAVNLQLSSSKKRNWENFMAEEPMGLVCEGLSKPYPEQVSATIAKDGYLYVSSPKNRIFRSMVMPSGNLHLIDISLFYMNLRENVEERWNAYQNRKILSSK